MISVDEGLVEEGGGGKGIVELGWLRGLMVSLGSVEGCGWDGEGGYRSVKT